MALLDSGSQAVKLSDTGNIRTSLLDARSPQNGSLKVSLLDLAQPLL